MSPVLRSDPARTAPGDGTPTVVDQSLSILRRQWWIVLLAIILAGALTAGYASLQDEEFTSESNILFRPDVEAIEGTSRVASPEREAATNEALLSLGVVAAGAADRLGGDLSASEVAETIEVVASPEADIVDIRATTTSAELSARVATSYAGAFVDFRRTSARERIDQAIRGARNVLQGLSDTQRDGQAGADVRQRLNQLETTRSFRTGGVELVQRAEPPVEASAPKPIRSGILGGVLGAVLGLSIVALRARHDRKLRTVEDAERAFGRPVHAEIPRTPDLARGDMGPIGGEESEAFRMLRASLRYFNVDADTRSLLVASAASGEGKSTVARRLAETMAAMGDSVVLVEADLHRPSSFAFGTDGGDLGLSTVLTGGDLDDLLADYLVESPTGEPRTVTVLRNGPLPPNPSELLESGRMADILVELRSRFDSIVIDSAPLPVLSDALPLVSQVDGVIAVSALGRSTQEGVRDFLRLVTLNGGNLLGVVVNFAPRADRSASFYYKRS